MTLPPEPVDAEVQRKREERDVLVARTLAEVRGLVATLSDVTSDLARHIDDLIEGNP